MNIEEAEKWVVLLEAFIGGKKIEFHAMRRVWRPVSIDQMIMQNDIDRYRIADPYRDLKEAHGRGEVIEYNHPGRGWEVVDYPSWVALLQDYRAIPKEK